MSIIHSALSIATKPVPVLLGLFGIGFLIAFHELGHYLMCRLFNIKTPTFSIGFGPRLFSKKWQGTEFTLSAIPLGGYVEIEGLAEVGQGEQKGAHSRAHDAFSAKPYYQKILVMIGGILFNMLFAYVGFTILYLTGIPKTRMLRRCHTTHIEAVEPGSFAEKTGIRADDHIISIEVDGTSHEVDNDIAALSKLIHSSFDHATLLIERDGKEKTITLAQPNESNLGISFMLVDIQPQGFFEAVSSAVASTNRLAYGTMASLMHAISNRDASSFGGPIALFKQSIGGAQEGLKIFLLLMILISVSLATLNLLPLPVFDGGQILFCTIEALARRELPIHVRTGIHIATWLLLVLFMLFMTHQDLCRIINDSTQPFPVWLKSYAARHSNTEK